MGNISENENSKQAKDNSPIISKGAWFFVYMVVFGISLLIYTIFFCNDCGTTSIGCYDSGMGYCRAFGILGIVILFNNLIAWGKYDEK